MRRILGGLALNCVLASCYFTGNLSARLESQKARTVDFGMVAPVREVVSPVEIPAKPIEEERSQVYAAWSVDVGYGDSLYLYQGKDQAHLTSRPWLSSIPTRPGSEALVLSPLREDCENGGPAKGAEGAREALFELDSNRLTGRFSATGTGRGVPMEADAECRDLLHRFRLNYQCRELGAVPYVQEGRSASCQAYRLDGISEEPLYLSVVKGQELESARLSDQAPVAGMCRPGPPLRLVLAGANDDDRPIVRIQAGTLEGDTTLAMLTLHTHDEYPRKGLVDRGSLYWVDSSGATVRLPLEVETSRGTGKTGGVGLGPLAYAATIPLDIVTFPFQAVYYGLIFPVLTVLALGGHPW